MPNSLPPSLTAFLLLATKIGELRRARRAGKRHLPKLESEGFAVCNA
jgi:hypothetical protein